MSKILVTRILELVKMVTALKTVLWFILGQKPFYAHRPKTVDRLKRFELSCY